MPHGDPIDELSVIQRGRAAGYTSYVPVDDNSHLTRGKLLDMIAMLMGGRMAEAVRLDDISTGAQNDLKRATELARRMVTEFGMSDAVGPVFLAGDAEVFIGREWGHQREYSENMAADIDREVRRIVEEGAERARSIIEENAEAMTRAIAALIDNEHLTGSEFDRLLEGTEDWKDKPSEAHAEDDPEENEPGENSAGEETVHGENGNE